MNERTALLPKPPVPGATRRTHLKDRLIERGLLGVASLTIVFLFLILLFLIQRSLPAIQEVGLREFLTGTRWMPSSRNPGYGAFAMIFSSVMVAAGALVLSAPWGVGVAVFVSELAPKALKEVLKPTVETLAIFPSVVIGFVGLVVVAPRLASLLGLSHGLTALTGIIMLSIMALPTIISISEDAINSVPREYKEAAYALGATKTETILRVTLPAARSGISAAIMLGFGRAIGETMTLLMVAGNALSLPITHVFGIPVPNLLASVRTLTATIAIEGLDVPWRSLHFHSLFVLGGILFTFTFVVNLIADIVLHKWEVK